MMLTVEAFERAAGFIVDNARGVEVARYAIHFEEGNPGEVDEELQAYGNDDGGFAYGIDPDFYCEESSAAATATALAILNETGAPPESTLVRGAIAYLLATHDPALKGWQKVPETVNHYPHGEWWDHPDGLAVRCAEELWALTNVDVIAHLHDYPMLVPDDVLQQGTAEALARLTVLPDPIDMHVLAAYELLSRRLDPERSRAMVTRLARASLVILERNPERWSAHVASPLWISPSVDSPLVTVAPSELEQNLDYVIAAQRPDGSWRTRRRWSDYADAWPEAEVELAGIATLEALIQLREFNRIEGF